MKHLLIELSQVKAQEMTLKKRREELEIALYELVQSELPADGSKTLYADEYKLTIKPNYSVKVNQELAADYAQYFNTKYEISYPKYRDLDNGAKKYVDEIVTINTLKPTFTVEVK